MCEQTIPYLDDSITMTTLEIQREFRQPQEEIKNKKNCFQRFHHFMRNFEEPLSLSPFLMQPLRRQRRCDVFRLEEVASTEISAESFMMTFVVMIDEDGRMFLLMMMLDGIPNGNGNDGTAS